MFESQDSDLTNLKNCAEYCFAFKEYSSGHLHFFFVFLMQKYIDFYHIDVYTGLQKWFQRKLFKF